MSWTDERVDELKRMWAEGHSASQIANALGGVSRNAVIGKIHRLGLSGRVKNARPAPRRTPPARPKPAQAPQRVMAVGATVVKVVEREVFAPIAMPQPAEVVPITGGVPLMELSACACRWPVGDPSDDGFLYCGARTTPGETYCKAHAQIAFPARAKAAKKAD